MKRNQALAAFWRELRRRHVVRTGGMYVAAGFVVLQLGEIVLPAFNAPDWVLQSLVVVAFLGLPVVLAFAWVYDMTPEGLAKTREAERGQRATAAPRVALVLVTSVSVALGVVWFQRSGATRGDEGAAAAGPADEAGQPAAMQAASLDPDAPVTAVAVLPLADFAQGDDFFARQLHEEIITQLSILTSLRIVSRTSVERYADSDMLLPQIAGELGVQAVVTGSVAMTSESDSVRISIQLLHAATDTHIMSRSFQREMKDILRLQTEVAVEIAEAVQGEVGAVVRGEVEQVAAVDPEAYRAFLRGQEELERGTPEGLEAALAHFDRSAELDPDYAQPLAWRAGTHLMLASQGDSIAGDVLNQVQDDVERAGLLGGAEDEVAATMVILGDHVGAGLERIGAGIEDAIAQAGSFAGFVTDSLRRRQLLESTRFGRQFGRRSPLAAAMGYLETGRYDSAAVAFGEILDADPGMVPAWAGLEEAHLRQGHYGGAVEVREQRILATHGEAPEAMAAVERLHATFDEEDPVSYWQWRQEDNAQREARGERVSEVEKATIAVSLGQHEDALRHLDAAVRNRDPALVTLRSNAVWDPLRSDPRFQDVVQGVREVWRTRGRPPRPGAGAPGQEVPRAPGIP